MSTVKKHKTNKKTKRKKVIISWERKLSEDFKKARRDAARIDFSKIFIGV